MLTRTNLLLWSLWNAIVNNLSTESCWRAWYFGFYQKLILQPDHASQFLYPRTRSSAWFRSTCGERSNFHRDVCHAETLQLRGPGCPLRWTAVSARWKHSTSHGTMPSTLRCPRALCIAGVNKKSKTKKELKIWRSFLGLTWSNVERTLGWR